MRVHLVRHAIAEERGRVEDHDRRLTGEGTAKMRRAAEGLRGLVGSDALLFSSRLVRAVQTAGILADVIGHSGRFRELDGLEPEADPLRTREEILDWDYDEVVIVGHEPHLGSLLSALVGGGAFRIKKGGTACVDLRGGRGELRWLLAPKQLRALRW